MNKTDKIQKTINEASFAAGCFWGVEDAFMQTKGVVETEVGYMGGHTENPTYEKVCNGDTGHAETVHLYFDPSEISFDDLVNRFFEIHNPTTKNRQGPDVGSQYRSIIFYYTDKQREIAEEKKTDLDKSGKYNSPIVTEIVPASVFYIAEEYHQKYHQKNGGVCSI